MAKKKQRWHLLEPWETDGKGWCVSENGVIIACMKGDKRPAAVKQADAATMCAAPILREMLAEAVELIAPGVAEKRVRAMRSILAHLDALHAEQGVKGGGG